MLLDNPANYLTLFLICFTETVMLYCTYTVFLNRNLRPSSRYYLSLFAYFCAVIYTSVNYFSVFYVSLLCFVLTALIAFYFFRETTPVKLTVAFLFVALNYACTIFVDVILWRITGEPFEHFFVILKQSPGSQIGLFLLFSLTIWLIHLFRKMQLSHPRQIQLVFVSAVPFVMLFLLMRIFVLGRSLHNAEYLFSFYLGISGLLFSIALSLLFWVDRITTVEDISQKKATMEQMLAMQSEYYAAMDEQQKELQGWLHDLNNHMRYINAMLDEQHYAEAKQYIAKMYTTIFAAPSAYKTGNRVFDAILNQKLPLFPPDVKIDINIIIPPCLSIDDVDICILLGNLIDNASEACNRVSEKQQAKFLVLKAEIKKNFLRIHVANSFNGEVRNENNFYQSVKTVDRYCGVGLTNVQRVVHKYDGTLTITHTHNVFSVTILLNLGLYTSTGPNILTDPAKD